MSVDAATAEFFDQVATVMKHAQDQVFTLMTTTGPLETSDRFGPVVFPAPAWAQLFADQAAIVHEASRRLRDLAPMAPDPERFKAIVDAWDTALGGGFENSAAAARLSDGGAQFNEVQQHGPIVPGTTIEPDAESLTLFLRASPGYHGQPVIEFGPGSGE